MYDDSAFIQSILGVSHFDITEALSNYAKAEVKRSTGTSRPATPQLEPLAKNNFDNALFKKLLSFMRFNINVDNLIRDAYDELINAFFSALHIVNIPEAKTHSAAIHKQAETKAYEQYNPPIPNPFTQTQPKTNEKERGSLMRLTWAFDRNEWPVFANDGVQLLVDERGDTYHPEEIPERDLHPDDWRYEEDYDRSGRYIPPRQDRGRADPRAQYTRDNRGGRAGGHRGGGMRSRSSAPARSDSMYGDDEDRGTHSRVIQNSTLRNRERNQEAPVRETTRRSHREETPAPKATTVDFIKGNRDLALAPWPIMYRPTTHTVNYVDGLLTIVPRESFNLMEYLDHEINPLLRRQYIEAAQIREFGQRTTSFESVVIGSSDITQLREAIAANTDFSKLNMINFLALSPFTEDQGVRPISVDSFEGAVKLMRDAIVEVAHLDNVDSDTAVSNLFNIQRVFKVTTNNDEHKRCKNMVEDLESCRTFAQVADALQRANRIASGGVRPPYWFNEVIKYYAKRTTELLRFGLGITADVDDFIKFGMNAIEAIRKNCGDKIGDLFSDNELGFIQNWNSDRGNGRIRFNEETNEMSIIQVANITLLPEAISELNFNFIGRDGTSKETYGSVQRDLLPVFYDRLADVLQSFVTDDSTIGIIDYTPSYLVCSDGTIASAHRGLLFDGTIIVNIESK